MSDATTAVANPVKQMLVAFVAARKGRDVFAPQGAEEAGKRWVSVTREQARFDRLLFELGDHAAPPAPILDSAKSPTNQLAATVTGTTEPFATLAVLGAASAASAQAGSAGTFSLAVTLNENANNILEVRAADLAGNAGAATTLAIRHDGVDPVVAITSPANGTSTQDIVIEVAAAASDDVGLREVRVNGVPAAEQTSGEFRAAVTLNTGANLVRAEAEDEAGNLSVADVTIHHQRPPAFALLGPAGGAITVTQFGFANGASIVVPTGALPQPTYVWIRETDRSQVPPLGGGAVALGPPMEFRQGGDGFAAPVTVGVPFDPTLVPAVWGRASEVRLYRLDPSSSVFSEVAGGTAQGAVMTAQVSHFTIYQVGVPLKDVFVKTVAGNGLGQGAPSLFDDAWATPLPFPEWTAVGPDGRVFVSSYSGAATRVYELNPPSLIEVGTLNNVRGVGLAVDATGAAYVADAAGKKVWRLSGGTATVFAGGGSTAVTTAPVLPATNANLGAVLGVAIDPDNGTDLYIVGSQYYVADTTGVRLAAAAFTHPPAPPQLPTVYVCPNATGGASISPLPSLVVAVSPAAMSNFSAAGKFLYVADNADKTLDAINLGSSAVRVWPNASNAACKTLPVDIPKGERRTLLAPTFVFGGPAVLPFKEISGLAVGPGGDLYFSEREGQDVRVTSFQTGCTEQLAGNLMKVADFGKAFYAGECGFNGDGNLRSRSRETCTSEVMAMHIVLVVAILSSQIPKAADGGLEMRLRAPPSVRIGDPIELQLAFVNQSDVAAQVPEFFGPGPFHLMIIDLDSNATAEGMSGHWVKGGPKTIELAPGASHTQRFNLGSFFYPGPRLLRGPVPVSNVVLEGRYRVEVKTWPRFTKQVAAAEFTVTAGGRERDAAILRELLDGDGPNSPLEVRAERLAQAREKLTACCAGSPITEHVWASSLMDAPYSKELEASVARFMSAYPHSLWATPVGLEVKAKRQNLERWNHQNSIFREARPDELRRYREADGAETSELAAKLARGFVRDFPRSELAPELLAGAVTRLDNEGKRKEARELANSLVEWYPDSFPVRNWLGRADLLQARSRGPGEERPKQ